MHRISMLLGNFMQVLLAAQLQNFAHCNLHTGLGFSLASDLSLRSSVEPESQPKHCRVKRRLKDQKKQKTIVQKDQQNYYLDQKKYPPF